MKIAIRYDESSGETRINTYENVKNWDLFEGYNVLKIQFEAGHTTYINKDYILDWTEYPEEGK